MIRKLFSIPKIVFVKSEPDRDCNPANQAKVIALYPEKSKKKKKLTWFHF